MDSCVLLPRDFSLVLMLHPNPRNIMEMSVAVWSNATLTPGTTFYPDEGHVRLDKLEIYALLDQKDIRRKLGCYDLIQEVDGREVRHCNWIRFVKSSKNIEEVNMVGCLENSEPVFKIVKPVRPNDEIVAYFDAPEVTDRLPEKEEEDEMVEIDVGTESPLPFLTSDSESVKSDSDSLKTEIRSIKSEPETYNLVAEPEVSPVPRVITPLKIVSPVSSPNIDTTSSPLGRDDECRSGASDVTSSDDVSSTSSRKEYSPLSSTHSEGVSPEAQLPVKRNREKTWLPCEVCGKKFDRPSLLKRHIRTHTGEKPHACDVCGKAFSTSSSLNTHRRIHSGEKPHQCQVCGKCFTASSNLYYHRMTHNKEKPHKCTMCSKSFPTPGDLRSHMYVHNGSWPYKCGVCNRGFSKQTNLKNHLLLHTGDKPHACTLCGKRFALQCNLKTHMKTHEADDKDMCIRCDQVYLTASGAVINGLCTVCRDDSSASPVSPKDSKTPPKYDFSISNLTGENKKPKSKKTSPSQDTSLHNVHNAFRTSPPGPTFTSSPPEMRPHLHGFSFLPFGKMQSPNMFPSFLPTGSQLYAGPETMHLGSAIGRTPMWPGLVAQSF